MDYGNLAQLSNPGQSPLGPNAVDPLSYMRWMDMDQMQRQALQKSVPLAEMSMQQSQQKHKEYMAGSQGREDLVTLGNMNAAESIAPEQVAWRKKLSELKNAVEDKTLREKLNNQLSEILPYGAGYASANDPAKQQALLDSLSGKTLNGHLFGQNPVKDKQMLEAAGVVAHGQPKEQIKRDVEDRKVAGKLEAIKAKGITDMQIAAKKAEWAKELQSARLAIKDNKPLSLSQQEALDLVLGYPNVEDRLDYYFAKQQATPKVQEMGQRAATANSVISGGGLQVPAPQPVQRPVPSTPPAAPAKPTTQPATTDKPKKHPALGTKISVQSNDGKKYEAEIIGISADGSKVNIKLPDGTKQVINRGQQ